MTGMTTCQKCGGIADPPASGCPYGAGCGPVPQPGAATAPGAAPASAPWARPAWAWLRVGAVGEPIAVADGARIVLGHMSEDDMMAAAFRAYDDVKGYHAAFVVHNGRVELRDLKSRHRTYVGDRVMPSGGVATFELPVMIRLGRSCYVRLDLTP
jgi:hypothetical protein